MAATRVECTLAGFERNWIDVSEQWTQRESVEMLAAADESFYALLRRKTVACHIELVTGAVVETPADLDANTMLDADVAVIGWLGAVMPIAVARRRTLGNAFARLSSNGKG